eukprot:6317745-Amphidinium_carterae.1
MERGQPMQPSHTSMFIPSRTTEMPIPSDCQVQTQSKHIIQWCRVSLEEVQHLTKDSMQEGQRNHVRPVDYKLLSIHGLVVNEDSKEMQKITSEIILQDFYVDADGVGSDKVKQE